MKFETILNLVSPEFSQNSPLADKSMYVYDQKGRKLTSLNFYNGYSITERSKEELKRFCEYTDDKEVHFFMVYIHEYSICIHDIYGFRLWLERSS